MSDTQNYIALIRKEDGTDFWVDAPDIPGCVSHGVTIDEAMENFREALVMHIQAMKENKQTLSPPRDKDNVLATEEDEWHQAYWVEIASDDTLHTKFSRISDL